MKYATLRYCDIADGTGVRTSLYVSGCNIHCPGCHNKEAQDFNYGKEFTVDTLDDIMSSLSPNYIDGLSILGGEPFELENQETISRIVDVVRGKFPNKTIWIYTGYILEKDLSPGQRRYIPGVTDRILNSIDVLVDGPFIEDQKDISLEFRGSRNQRLLNMRNNNAEL